MIYPIGEVCTLRTADSAHEKGRAFELHCRNAKVNNEAAPLASNVRYCGVKGKSALYRLKQWYNYDYVADAMIDTMHTLSGVVKHLWALLSGKHTALTFQHEFESVEDAEATRLMHEARVRDGTEEKKQSRRSQAPIGRKVREELTERQEGWAKTESRRKRADEWFQTMRAPSGLHARSKHPFAHGGNIHTSMPATITHTTIHHSPQASYRHPIGFL